MTYRAPTGSQTCSGTPTGQSLSYDAEERLLTWQNVQSSPTSSAGYGCKLRLSMRADCGVKIGS